MIGFLVITALSFGAQSPAATIPDQARLSLDPVFGEHMVLQCEQPVLLWGTAPPNIRVHIALGLVGRDTDTIASVHVNAKADGSWQAELPAQPASFERYRIDILANSQMVRFEDVLFGEVWFAAGQSNMEWPLSRSEAWPALLDRMAANPIDARNLGAIRFYQAAYTATGAGGTWDQATVDGLAPDRFRQGNWSVTSAKSIASMSAVAWYFGEELLGKLDRPIGLIDVAAGGTPAEAWVSREALARDPRTSELVRAGNWLDNEMLGAWCRERASQNLARALEDNWQIPQDETGPHHAFQPGFLWQTAVEPFMRVPVRGVLWYQGESNAGSAERVVQHEAIFRRLVASWRTAWAQPDLPFLFVQLPAMNRDHWPAFREQQRQLERSITHTGMAVTLELGDPNDVHPRRKQPVGERLARLARHLVYGQDCLHTGPRAIRAYLGEKHITVEFTAFGDGMGKKGAHLPAGFEWQDQEGRWRIADVGEWRSDSAAPGDLILKLILATPERAQAIRYAWAPAATATVFDSDGLPASPFLIRIEKSEQRED